MGWLIFACGAVYVVCIAIFVKFSSQSKEDRERVLKKWEMVMVMVWFSLFITTQMILIHLTFEWLDIL